LTSALDENGWSASLSGRFTPRERAPFTHFDNLYALQNVSEWWSLLCEVTGSVRRVSNGTNELNRSL